MKIRLGLSDDASKCTFSLSDFMCACLNYKYNGVTCITYIIVSTYRGSLENVTYFHDKYLESSFSMWISMWNFIMNVPQTLILFKIASAILAVQK